MAKVLIKLNDLKQIVDINSDIFIDDENTWVEIDSGDGYQYAHAQGSYLEKGLTDEQGRYNYKYINDKVVEIPDNEKEDPITGNILEEPSIEDRLDAIDSAIAELADIIGGGEE